VLYLGLGGETLPPRSTVLYSGSSASSANGSLSIKPTVIFSISSGISSGGSSLGGSFSSFFIPSRHGLIYPKSLAFPFSSAIFSIAVIASSLFSDLNNASSIALYPSVSL
jgi:hypothetical protein